MAKKSSKSLEIASVLAFEKKIVPSDGYMSSTKWEKRSEEAAPIQLVEKSVRGTISNRFKEGKKFNVEDANLQTVDSAALRLNDDTLLLQFSVKFLAGVEKPSACDNPAHYDGIMELCEAYSEQCGFEELATRYAMNLANGRFLWRNRVGAEAIEIHIEDTEGEVEWVFDAYDFSLKDFSKGRGEVAEIAQKIAAALSGETSHLLLNVKAFVKMGNGQEVYPSEELVLNKGNSRKSKILYAVAGQAAMHSQKLGNALRTIDTWYPEYEEAGIGPIAVEPYGVITSLKRVFRSPESKKDFYTLFDAASTVEDSQCSVEDGHYVMAVLIRGGVFGKSSKE